MKNLTTHPPSNSISYRLYSIFIFFLISTIIQAQNGQWQNYVSNEDVKDLKNIPDGTWIATTGGLILLDNESKEIARYTSLNSDLPCNSISEIEIDKDDILWIHHCSGISSFDGEIFKNYDIDINNELGFGYDKMILDHDRNLRVFNEEGYYFWNGSTFEFIGLGTTDHYLALSDIYVESDKVIWVAKFTYGVFQISRYEDGGMTVFDYNNSELPFEHPAKTIFVNQENQNLAICLSNTFFEYDGTTWKKIKVVERNIVDLKIQEDGNIRVLLSEYLEGNIKASIGVLSKDYELIEGSIKNLDGDYPEVLSINNNGDAFVGFSATGLLELKDNEISKVHLTKSHLVSNAVQSMDLVKDKLWFHIGRSEYERVGSIITHKDFIWEEKKETYPFSDADRLSLHFDRGLNDTTYLNINRKSFYQVEDDTWAPVSNPDLEEEVDENDVSVYIDTYGHKWLMELYNSKIYYKNSEEWKVIPHEVHGAASAAYFSRFNHPVTGDLWLSTYNGVSIYNYESDTWSIVDHQEMNIADRPLVFVTTASKELYGIGRKEFFRLNGPTAEVIVTADSISDFRNATFYSIFLDSKERIWLGLDGMVAIYDEGAWSYLTIENSGIINGGIISIKEDEEGNYWFASKSGGIALYNGDGLEDGFFNDVQLSVKDIQNIHPIEVFPVPMDGIINYRSLDANILKGVASIGVYDVTGNQVMKVKVSKNQEINLSDLVAGVYIICFSSDAQFYSVKIIKE